MLKPIGENRTTSRASQGQLCALGRSSAVAFLDDTGNQVQQQEFVGACRTYNRGQWHHLAHTVNY